MSATSAIVDVTPGALLADFLACCRACGISNPAKVDVHTVRGFPTCKHRRKPAATGTAPLSYAACAAGR